MSTTVACETITERLLTVKLSNKKLREDRPSNLKELEALELLKVEVQGWILNHMDDYFLLRFLRARKLNVKKAKEMLKNYVNFRKTDKHFLHISQNPYAPPLFLFDEAKLPFLRTFDCDGRTVFVAQGGHICVRRIFEKLGRDEFIQITHYCAEFLLHLIAQQRQKYGCTKVICIVDLEGLSLRKIYFPGCIQLAIHLITTVESFYPELLHLGIVINANKIVHWAYKILSPFASEAILEKLHIYGRDPEKWKGALRQHVPEEVLPKGLGGTGPDFQLATPQVFEGFRVSL